MDQQKQPVASNLSDLLEKTPPKKTQIAKAGEVIPVKILLVKGDQLQGAQLPQLIKAVKDFDLYEAMTAYHFQNPFQPIMLNQFQPDVAVFNSASLKFRNWLVDNGYAEAVEFTSDLTIRMWTPEEIAEDNKMKQMVANALAGGEEIQLDQNGSPIDVDGFIAAEKAALAAPVNVGTVGHVDHGRDSLAAAVAADSAV